MKVSAYEYGILLEYEVGEPRSGYVTVTLPQDGAAPVAVLSPGPLARRTYQTPTLTLVESNRYVKWCQFCGRSSLKEAWGPGWIRCPRCERVQLSPAELSPPVPGDATSEGVLYRAVLSIADGSVRDPRTVAEEALEAWHKICPTYTCYRCEWGAGECSCPQGPLIVNPKRAEA